MDLNSLPLPERGIKNILDQTSLKWIFVGGKGGVGKTSAAASLSLRLAKCRESVLVISTDPAHNLSDAFNQPLSRRPTPIKGIDGVSNLFAMEVQPKIEPEELAELEESEGGGIFADLIDSIPGIDEAMSFAELIRYVGDLEFSVVVFDTAPTGHTLRLLSFPTLLDKALSKLITLKSRFGPLLQSFMGFFGGGAGGDSDEDENGSGVGGADGLMHKLEAMKTVINEVNNQFQNPQMTTFVCVCIAEFLSLYETERLIQELFKYGIDTHNIIVNQLVPECKEKCDTCTARRGLQRKYLQQIFDLYCELFNITPMYLMPGEVRGVESLGKMGEKLLAPPEVEDDIHIDID